MKYDHINPQTITMIANYHTHTWRCNHAKGLEKEYIENAIKSGLKVLGFSDHTPYIYRNNYISKDKMLPSQLEDYVDTILSLRDEYKDDIDIRLGLEVEYYPLLWEDLLHLIEPYPIEYMLLGQHYLDNEFDNPKYCGKETNSLLRLKKYCQQCIEALNTGKFLYFAHPDLINYSGDIDTYIYEMTMLCRYCKENGVPLELNFLGIRKDRKYPNLLFWKIASHEGNKIVYGSDAHSPEHVCSESDIVVANELLYSCDISIDGLMKELPIASFQF